MSVTTYITYTSNGTQECVNVSDLRQIIVFEQDHMYSQLYNSTDQPQQGAKLWLLYQRKSNICIV